MKQKIKFVVIQNRPLPNSQAELELALRNRTVYVKGFPKTDDINIDKLLKFFEK